MEENQICGGCLLYMETYLGGECRLTDNPVEYTQPACIDHIADDSGDVAEIDDYKKGVSKHGKSKRNA